MTVYTTLPTDDENLEVTVIDDPDLVVLNINPASISGAGGTGTVTNVATGTGLTGGPITTTGTISIDETSDISFNSVTADFFGVQHFTAKARETITAGQPVYISGHSGNTPEVMVADFDDPTKMPAFGIASSDIADNNNGTISTYGDLKNIDTTGTNESETWAVGDELYVNNSKLTNTRPTGSTEAVQKIAKIIRVHANNGQMFLMGAGRTNDIPNLDSGKVFIGNGSGYDKRALTTSDVTNSAGYISADSTDTLTNKSGNISMFTNDAGYLTSDSDAQTLSFANPNLSISNGNSVDLSALTPSTLAWSAITGTPTTLSGYGITDGYDNADVDAHLNTNQASANEVLTWSGSDWEWSSHTTINNNADNRIITGSATADTLEGEADFTWDGNKGVIDGSAVDLTTPVLNIKTDNSNWNLGQMMLTDSNDDVCTLVGANRSNFYEYNFTLDPNNTHGRTGVVTSPGEYFVAFRKDYSDAADVGMNMTVFGAHKGFDIVVRDDGNNYGGNQYKGRPLNLNALETNINCGLDRDVLALTVKEESIDCKVPIGQVQLSADPSSPENGWTYYNTSTHKLRLYANGAWVDLN